MKLYYMFLVCVSATISHAKSVGNGTSNSYGDELVTPEGGGAKLEENVVPEEGAKTIHDQLTNYTRTVETSGYRRKRAGGNSYGDEQIVPPKEKNPVLSDNPLVEQVSAQLLQDSSHDGTGVVSSGYRKKRNSYGDELVTPPTGGGAQGYDEVEEKTAPTVEQTAGSTEAVQPSGY